MLCHILSCLYLKIPENLCISPQKLIAHTMVRERKKSFNNITIAQEEKADLHLNAVCLKFSKVIKHGYGSVLSHYTHILQNAIVFSLLENVNYFIDHADSFKGTIIQQFS